MNSESIPLLLFIAVIIWLAIRFSRKFFSPENEDKAADEYVYNARDEYEYTSAINSQHQQ